MVKSGDHQLLTMDVPRPSVVALGSAVFLQHPATPPPDPVQRPNFDQIRGPADVKLKITKMLMGMSTGWPPKCRDMFDDDRSPKCCEDMFVIMGNP